MSLNKLFLFSALLIFQSQMAFAGAISSGTTPNMPYSETWGGDHIRFTNSGHSGSVKMDCAAGEIQNGLNFFDTKFDLNGTMTAFQGIGIGAPTPANFRIQIKGKTMSLRVTTSAHTETFSLKKNAVGTLYPCMLP